MPLIEELVFKFKVPNKSVFADTGVKKFQRRLLQKENADRTLKTIGDRLIVARETLIENIYFFKILSILFLVGAFVEKDAYSSGFFKADEVTYFVNLMSCWLFDNLHTTFEL